MSLLDPSIRESMVSTNGVDLHVLEAGPEDGPPAVLAHGFPELAFSWRHQLPALAAAGYRAIAPDQRGYGSSTKPDAVEDYDIIHLTDDIVGLLDQLGLGQAVIVGHDWGAMVAWQSALLHPDRYVGVVGMSVPFLPRGAEPPVQLMRRIFGDTFFYIVYFQEPGVADAELGADPARTMRRLLAGVILPEDGQAPDRSILGGTTGGRGFVDRMPEPDQLPAWLRQDELDHYAAEFARTGFTGGINWYRNMDRNWGLTEHLAGAKVTQPAAFIGGKLDPVLLMSPPAAMAGWLEDDRGTTLVERAGHWVQQEKPGEVNAALLAFLAGIDLPRS